MTGFYKADGGQLLHGPNYVLNAEYELLAESHADHEYPVDGWHWFDTEDEAREFLGIPAIEPLPDPDTGLPIDRAEEE